MGALKSRLKAALTIHQKLIINALLNRGNSRFVLRALLSTKSKVHQVSGDTSYDRYSSLFLAARKILTQSSPKILSFGCSTGEEVLTLRRYFPNAVIVGSEIDAERLEICRARPVDGNIRFIDATEESLRTHGPYDAIFAMAVLQRLPHTVIRENIEDLTRLYPFRRFEAQLAELDQHLRPSGVMFIKNTQYRFCDTEISTNYEVVLSEARSEFKGRIYGKDSKLLHGEKYLDVGFRKCLPINAHEGA